MTLPYRSLFPEEENKRKEIFAGVLNMVETLFRLIQPRELFFLAIDGVAPRAKWNKQRQRR